MNQSHLHWAFTEYMRKRGIPNYCIPCGEMLNPEDWECPFCQQKTTPCDELGGRNEQL